jgi:hypothetical protein
MRLLKFNNGWLGSFQKTIHHPKTPRLLLVPRTIFARLRYLRDRLHSDPSGSFGT